MMILRKPKFWTLKRPNIYAYLLFPISLLINLFNSIKVKSKNKTKIKTICIGNIYIGGTGKTSLCIKINQILKKEKIKSCFIKKKYNNQIDEQKLLQKNGKLYLSSKRVSAIKQAEKENYEIAILDDGLQDNSINCDLNFVCFNNINWIGNGMTIPSGPLRENISNLKNYENIFLNGNLENLTNLEKYIKDINPKINIHVGKYEAINLDEFKKSNNYLVFTGIGNHQTFVSMLKESGLRILKDLEFPDHFKYSEKDINNIILEAGKLNCDIITTEKDYLRLDDLKNEKIKFIKGNLKIIDEDKLIKTIFSK